MVNVKAWSVAKRKAEGFGDISSFMKKRRGRPKKRATIAEVVRASAKPKKVSAVPNAAIKNLIVETNDNATTGNESGNALQSADV